MRRLSVTGNSGVWRKSESRCGSDPPAGPGQVSHYCGRGHRAKHLFCPVLKLGKGGDHHVVLSTYIL